MLVSLSWELYTETLAFWLGYGDGEDGETMRQFLREGVDAAAYAKLMEHLVGYDVGPLLAEIQCPVLVMQPRQGRLVDAGTGRGAAECGDVHR